LKILILKPSSMGDVVQAMPVLRLIKRHLPSSRVYWWVETGLAGLFAEDPDLHDILHFRRNGWGSPLRWKQLWEEIRWMRAQEFDWVIDLQCLARSGAFAWFANGNRTVGLDEPREGARCLYDRIIQRNRVAPHAVDWYLDVLPVLGVPKQPFTWLPPKLAAAAAIRRKWPVESRRWIVIQPGARWPNKCWPAEYYSSLVRQLARSNPALGFAILGTAQEKQAAAQILESAPERSLDLTGQLSLPEMIEWIRASELMVGNDTGPIHVAAAIGKPVVAIFGPTDPHRTGPYGQMKNVVRAQLPCSPCLKDTCKSPRPLECLHAVTQQMVARAAEQILNHRQ
jgi:heptosyltransferase I